MSHIARKGIHRSALIPECQAEGQISFARALVRKAELVLVVSVAWKAEVAVEANLAVHTSRASLAYTEFPARTRLGPLSRHRIKTRIWTKLPSPTFMLRQIQSWSLNSTAAAEPNHHLVKRRAKENELPRTPQIKRKREGRKARTITQTPIRQTTLVPETPPST